MGEIRLAIVGVGNCTSNLIQGLHYYRKVDQNAPTIPGLMHKEICGYGLQSIKPVVAFDVHAQRVGKDISEAIWAEPNNTVKIADVPFMNVPVLKGPVLDGIGEFMGKVIPMDMNQKPVNVARTLQDNGVQVLLNFLPVGSADATRFYAEECLKAGCAMVNAIPEFIASDPAWARKFEEKKLPIVGDDSKAQFGSTIVHRVLTRLCQERGTVIDNTYQLNVGGNTDFYNMLERTRLKSKKISKTEAVQSQMNIRLPDDHIHIGPSDFVPWLKSTKLGFIRIEGRLFGDVPFNIECRLEVEDKANSSGVVIDAIRCAKVALDRGVGGTLISPSAYLCKHPPQQYPDSVARQMVEEFISGHRER